MLLGTQVDAFMLAASSANVADKIAAYFGKSFLGTKSIACGFFGVSFIRDWAAQQISWSKGLLIINYPQLETAFDGIMQCECLVGNDLWYNLSHSLHKGEALCPCSTASHSQTLSIFLDDCPAVPDSHLIHGLPVSVGILLYSLHPRPNLMHSVHQLSSIFQNLGPPHVKAVDHGFHCLAGLIDLPFVLGDWAEINKQFSCVSLLVGLQMLATKIQN